MSIHEGFDSKRYGPTCWQLLGQAHPMDVGRGTPEPGVASAIEAAADELAGAAQDRDLADCCVAGLWLRFGYLDRSHALSQKVHNVDGSYWHALMHRHEPDYGNSKYWFRQVGHHAVFDPLCEAARQLAADHEDGVDSHCEFLRSGKPWDPFAAVDWCQAAASGRAGSVALCQAVIGREWELLFDYCFRGATGQP